MKFENNNKNIIKKITKSSLKANKTRNIFAIIAIILTTFMISSVFTLGISFAKNYRVMNLRYQGTTATTFLPNPTDEQIKQIKDLNISDAIGEEISVGNLNPDELSKKGRNVVLQYIDRENWDKQISPAMGEIKGDYPEGENEIMVSEMSKKLLDIEDTQIGDKIKLTYEVNGKTEEKEFIISGQFKNYTESLAFMENGASVIYVSEDFVAKHNLSLEENGILSMTFKKSEKYGSTNLLEENVDLKNNQKFEFNYDVEEDSKDIEMSAIIVVGLIGAFMVLSGYLLIYNILYIAVTKDIQFYGMLKTIGASPKQIKKIVRGQGLRLSIVGIPIGIIISLAVSFLVVPYAIESFCSGTYYADLMPNNVHFTPLVFVGTILFSLFTVLISCRKPAKIASKVSPIEALNYTGGKPKKQKKNRKSTNGGKLYKMAWYNVFRDKKRAILVFLSLFMGILTFLSVITFMNSLSVDNYQQKYYPNDFELTNYGDNISELSDEDIETIKSIKGVTSVKVNKVSNLRMDMNEDILMPALNAGYERFATEENTLDDYLQKVKKDPSKLTTWVSFVDDETIDKFEKLNDDKIDVEAFKQGKIALTSTFYYPNYEELDFSNQQITFRNSDRTKSVDLGVNIVEDKNDVLNFGKENEIGIPIFYISESVIDKLDCDILNNIVKVDVDPKYEPSVKNKLKLMAEESKDVNLESKSDAVENFEQSMIMMNIIVGGISIILIFIGILNFINVMVTNVNTRLTELAVIESIGMTKRQIKKMLTFEGLYYAGITIFMIMTLGMSVVYMISKLIKNMVDYAEFVFPTSALILLVVLILLVCTITPSVVYKQSSKSSVTDRLRRIEK